MKKILLGVGGLLCVLAITAATLFFAVPEYRPSIGGGETYGVDVSNHQSDVNWQAVASDDIEFAYVKATEGMTFVDKQFNAHWSGAGAAGLRTGAYHFFTLCSGGAEQAANFLRVVPREPDALPAALDLEVAGNCSQRPNADQVDREVRALLEAVEEATGTPVLLYVGDDFENAYDIKDRVDRRLWQPRFMRAPSESNWDIWQVSGFARVEGIDGRADLNVARPGFLS